MEESALSKEVNDKRVSEFTEKLKALLLEYRANIELEEHSSSYYTNYNINLSFDGYPDEESGEYISYRDVNIGNGSITNKGEVIF